VIVLVTGATGFVGPHLVRALRAAGHEPWGTGLEPEPPAALSGDAALARYGAWDVGAGAAAGVSLLAGADAVVHLAGQSSAARSFADPAETFRANAQGTAAVLDAMAEAGCRGRLVCVSTSEVYAPAASATPLAEDAPLGPISPYGASKLAAEAACHARLDADPRVDVVIARSFSHTGPGQGPAFALASWARQVAEFEAAAQGGASGPFRLAVGNLAPVRDYADVRDVARAYVTLLAQGARGVTYNVASGRGVSLADALGLLLSRARVRIEVFEDPARRRPADLPYMVGDPSRLFALGFAPRHAFAETLDALLDGARREVGAPHSGGS
jgi:GDP-4-dehydro-6-deoxy-D-mannose reductase